MTVLSTVSSSPNSSSKNRDMKEVPPSIPSLSIGPQDATEMMEASRAFNNTLEMLRPTTNASSTTSSSNDDIRTCPQMLEEAASSCSHPLVKAFYQAITTTTDSTDSTDTTDSTNNTSINTNTSIQASLLLFLDTDKSTKLLTAFSILQPEINNQHASELSDITSQQTRPILVKEETEQDEAALLVTSSSSSTKKEDLRLLQDTDTDVHMDTPMNSSSNHPNEQEKDIVLRLHSKQIQTMLECFLTSISMCIRDQRSSSSSSSLETMELSSLKRTEIQTICSYAASQLAKEKSSSTQGISFEDFGDWYNDGGFQLVPWLELLALSKWDHGCFTTTSTSINNNNETSPPMLSASVSSSPPTATITQTTAVPSPTTTATTTNPSKCVVSFDFTSVSCDKPLHVDITEENLLLLKQVVTRTGLFRKSPQEMCQVLLKHGNSTIAKKDFGRCMRELISATNLTQDEIITFSNFLVGLFSCFDRQGSNVVNTKELAAGFAFLSGGNKSNKLAIAFELLDEHQEGQLSRENLTRFLRSFLAVIVGISMPTSRLSRDDMFHAVDNGASWTQSHVLSTPNKSAVTFDEFAEWYTEGGFTIAPWLELLDLSKFISLLDGDIADGSTSSANDTAAESSLPFLNKHNNYTAATTAAPQHPPKEVLFTFPLANENELIVLKDDVFYVRSVVDQLGLSNVRPEDVWTSLCNTAASACFSLSPWGGAYEVDQSNFVSAVDNSVAVLTGRRLDSNSKFTLSNFFSSYDLDQFNKVQLNQLMGGLALFCLGRKSAKLAFSFGLFDGRNNTTANHANINDPSKKGETGAALNGDELFLFLRSFLIVLFSCCAQSLELTSDGVSLWIHDTSKMVCGNVMRFQWNNGKRCVNFDDFGIWYNQGGFEVAPWLELLDLNKWFLGQRPSMPNESSKNSQRYSTNISTADSDLHAPIMDSPMGDFPYDFAGEFEQIIGQHDEKENCVNPSNTSRVEDTASSSSSLTFQLLMNDRDQGVTISITQLRVASLRQLLTESGFFRMEASRFCTLLISYSDKASGALSKDQYDNAMRRIVLEIGVTMSPETQQRLSDLLTSLFFAFDREKRAKVDAIEFAAGMTVLCGGRKSDKLEYAFELIDDDRDGKLSRQGLWRFLRSFLTVLVSLSSPDNIKKDERIISAVDNGASWAVSQAFGPESNSCLISFDDFAAWYTKGGYGIIPWLELLDLKKWVVFS